MRGDKSETTIAVELLQTSLDRSDVADDAVGRQTRQHFPEGFNGVLDRHCIDDEFGLEIPNLVQLRKAIAVIHESQTFRPHIVHRRLMLKTDDIRKERAHLTGSQYQNTHNALLVYDFHLLAHTLFVYGLKHFLDKIGIHATE